LYAVERAEDVPGWVEAATVETMRKEYAEAHLESLAAYAHQHDQLELNEIIIPRI
jgi:hypothetical protein